MMRLKSNRKIKWCSMALALLALGGCATTPPSSGFLGSYSEMTGKYSLDRVRIAPGVNFSSYDTLIIMPVNTKYLGIDDIQEGEDRKNILNKLEEHFRVALAPYFKTITSDTSQSGNSMHALQLEWAVTELRPTDVAKNLVWGFGVGNATATIEGRFVDTKTGQEIIAFTDHKKRSPFTKKEYDQQTKFPNWSKLRYLYIFTDIWAENVGNLVKATKH